MKVDISNDLNIFEIFKNRTNKCSAVSPHIHLICLDKGATVDAIGGELHATPLHWATRQGHLDACVILMNASADPTLRDAEGCSCIHLAAQFGHTALVSIID